jgi:hypothetical protein
MHTYFFKKKNVSNIEFAFHSKNSQIKYIVKYPKKNTSDLHINSKSSMNCFLNFLI